MDDGGQQVLVTEDDGAAAPLSNALLVQPTADVARLDMLGRGRDIGDVLGFLEVFVDVIGGAVQFVRKGMQVLGDIMASLVALHIVVVEVPIEAGLAGLLKGGEKLLLHLLQQVEAHKEVALVREARRETR